MNLKALIEMRNAKLAEMKAITAKAVEETRAITTEEDEQFKALEAEVRDLDSTIERAKAMQNAGLTPATSDPAGKAKPEMRDGLDMAEVREFAAYIRNSAGYETRAEKNLTMTDNGAIIPKTIAGAIIKKVYDISPIYAKATHFNVRGTLEIPYYDETEQTITVAWATEFTDLTSTSGKFKTIELTGFLAGALTKISRSLLNSQDFDLVSFVIADMSEKIARFIEGEIISGKKVNGLKGVTATVTAASQTAVTADELIDLQDTVKDVFQSGCIWVMSPKTRTALRKLKDGNGRYMLQDDLTSPFGKTLLGKPVYVTDAMPEMAASKDAIYYGDFSGLAVKTVEEPNIQVLNELFSIQHAIGAVAWLEFDAKVQDAQRIAKLTMGA